MYANTAYTNGPDLFKMPILEGFFFFFCRKKKKSQVDFLRGGLVVNSTGVASRSPLGQGGFLHNVNVAPGGTSKPPWQLRAEVPEDVLQKPAGRGRQQPRTSSAGGRGAAVSRDRPAGGVPGQAWRSRR